MRTIIIFGATGDLTTRKLLPALYRLYCRGKKFKIVGVARRVDQRATILKQAKGFVKDTKKWAAFSKCFSYTSLSFYEEKKYSVLKRVLGNEERIFYLATLPEHFIPIGCALAQQKLVRQKDKVVFEKPFGSDLKSALKINNSLAKAFAESQIYRIDHYLGKELVEMIALLRFTNHIFEPLWNNKHIKNVQIVLDESLDVAYRSQFYDKYGALKDVVQNHVLQLLALITMQAPKKLFSEEVRDQKARALTKVSFVDGIFGQYEGYLNHRGTKQNSQTETFAALKLFVNTARFKGVPFFIRTGKALSSKQTKIVINFKDEVCRLAMCPALSNALEIVLAPTPRISLIVNNKIVGKKEVEPLALSFPHSVTAAPNTPLAYESLFLDCFRGNKEAFVRFDEVKASWKIIEKALKRKKNVFVYPKGVAAPKEFIEWSRKKGVGWR